jgi:alpha-tubulin suppressor-like RCC1 family protein
LRHCVLLASALAFAGCGARTDVELFELAPAVGGSTTGGSSGAASRAGSPSVGGASSPSGLAGAASSEPIGGTNAGIGGASNEAGANDEAGASGAAGAVDQPPLPATLALGAFHSCTSLLGGRLRCWGTRGYIGSGNELTIGDDETPDVLADVQIGAPVMQMAASWYHTCVLLQSGAVRCFGDGADGELGYGNLSSIGDDETPATAGNVDVGGFVVQVALGFSHTCALLDSGRVRCWGRGSAGRPGYGNTNNIGDDETPASAGDVDLGGKAVQIVAGTLHTCALLDTGKVRCWGSGGDGALGYGNTNDIGDDETPASAGDVDVGGPVIQLAAGDGATCALLAGDTVRCWGSSVHGRLGYGNTRTIGDDETPAAAGDIDVGGPVARIAMGFEHSCALLKNGAVRCWGRGSTGALGYGNTADIGDDETPASAGDVKTH